MGDGGGRFPPEILTAVAVDKDKNSQHAVKWTVDHLLINTPRITLIHVRPPSTSGTYGLTGGFSVTEASPEAAQEQIDWETDEFFLPYRGFCARKGMQLKEVIMEDTDVSRAIVDYITANNVQNIVVGTSNRNALTRKFRNPDVPSLLLKAVPDFCTVYVISKGKAITVRSAKIAAPTKQASIQDQASPRRMPPPDHEDSVRAPRGALRGSAPATLLQPERVSFERFSSPRGKMVPTRDSRPVPSARSPRKNYFDGLDGSTRPPRLSDSCFSEEGECFPESLGSMDFRNSLEFSYASAESPPRTSSSASAASRDVEEEMRRLKLELKQTMDMYSTACKEAITAKQKAKELHQWKVEESRKFEELRSAEGAALAMAEMEKAKCKVAIEAAMAAQRIAELEAQKRINVERKAKLEEEEKKKALDALAHTTDIRYRKYTIEEIEAATENFVESLKIGEGGYGPVYRACLDHTPVAIKILRPDAAQGREQFQQEVEVLSCIRHPNMVLLLGACPENGCLVYEYMENGSLDDRLFRRGNTPTIPWSVRFRIAAEIATGLLFLHQTKPEPLVHRDLKPANILLDRNYTSKISDVGLARLVPPSVADTVTQYRMTSAAGTFCYIDPEYQQTGMLGTKSDVYSLGIMLLQVITAKPPMGLTHHVERAIERGRFEEMLDQTVTDWPVEEALAFAKLALKCAELRRKDRPDLGMVVLPELNRLRNLGHACAEHNSGSTACGFSGPRAYNSQLQAPGTRTSTLGQEQQRSEPNGRPQWMSAPDT